MQIAKYLFYLVFGDIKKEVLVMLSCFSGAGFMYFLNEQERFREG